MKELKEQELMKKMRRIKSVNKDKPMVFTVGYNGQWELLNVEFFPKSELQTLTTYQKDTKPDYCG